MLKSHDDCKSVITDYRPPTTGYRPPAAGYRSRIEFNTGAFFPFGGVHHGDGVPGTAFKKGAVRPLAGAELTADAQIRMILIYRKGIKDDLTPREKVVLRRLNEEWVR